MIPRMSFQSAHGGWRGLLESFRLLISGEAVARLIGFASIFVMARALAPGGFGVVMLGTTIVAFLMIFVDSGTEMLNVRNISREPRRFREIVEPILALRLALSVPSGAILGVIAVVATSGGDRVALALFAVVLPMMALNLRWMAVGVRASKAVAVSKVAKELVVLVGVVLLVQRAHDTATVALLIAAGELVSAIIVLEAVRRRFGLIRPRVNRPAWIENLRAGRPILVNSLARAVVYSFDVVLIAVLFDRHAVGLYTAAYKPVLFAVGALAIFFVSFLASYSRAEGEDAAQLFRRAVAIALGASLPVAILLSVGSELFCKLAYGDAYGGAATALAILIWCLPVMAVGRAYANSLIAGHREGRLMRINVIGALLNVAAALILVPVAGIEGAAAATLATEVMILVLTARSVVALGLERSPVAIIGDFLRWHVPIRTGTDG